MTRKSTAPGTVTNINAPHGIGLALYQPDIPGNTGTILRMATCLGVTVDVIEPAGFRFDDTSLKRAGLDYLERATLVRHANWEAFLKDAKANDRRLILLTTKSQTAYTSFEFLPGDVLVFGRESAGVPDDVHETFTHRLTIPMAQEGRSLNVAVSAAMVTGEALRQVTGFSA